MTLRDTTKKIIAELEQKSGYMVHVMEDPNLPVISTIRIARDHILAHVLTYRHGPKKEAPDYAIIFQCALALRLFACPPDDRMLIGNSLEGRDTLKTLPGDFSGLQLLSIQYVSFKQFAPSQDIGFDLSNEYQMALTLHKKNG